MTATISRKKPLIRLKPDGNAFVVENMKNRNGKIMREDQRSWRRRFSRPSAELRVIKADVIGLFRRRPALRRRIPSEFSSSRRVTIVDGMMALVDVSLCRF